jgi:tetratricopeptide (TPR) repeat protein
VVLPEGIPATGTEQERKLLERLRPNLTGAPLHDVLYELGCFYNRIARNDLAAQVMMSLMEHCADHEEQAFCYMSLGQIAEQQGQFLLALDYYRQGLKLKPSTKLVMYYLHNNIGFCLNTGKRYRDGELFCRTAIEIDSQRANGFKNLGISLEGQGDLLGAAWAYAEANRLDPADPNVLRLLRKTVARQPKVLSPLVYNFLTESPVQA